MLRWKPKVAVVGHSFIRDVKSRFARLAKDDKQAADRHTYARYFNLGDVVDGVEFVVVYRGEEQQRLGALEEARKMRPDICVIQLGANELADPGVQPLQAAFDVLETGRQLREQCGAKVCVFMSCIKRVNGHPYSEWGWWQRQTEFNRAIRDECKVVPGFEFAQVKGFVYDPEGHDLDIIKFLPDGCHPRNSVRGFWKYVRELRNCIMNSKIALAAHVLGRTAERQF